MGLSDNGSLMRSKVIAQTTITGQQGVNLVEQLVVEMGFIWYPTGSVEAGIDGFIELRDKNSEVVTNTFIAVQSKAVGKSFTNETESSLDFYCNEKDLDYWLKGNVPVLLVVSRPSTDEAYWLSIKDYFQDPAQRASRKARFDKQRNRFNVTCAASLMSLAIPKEAGVYLAPPPKHETLISNLLPVAFLPPRIFMADTHFRSPGDLWKETRASGLTIGGEWILRNQRILSFHDLSRNDWISLCDRGTVEDFASEEWSQADDADRSRDFVQLLSQALRSMVREDLDYNKRGEYFFFRPTKSLVERTFSYPALQRTTDRAVFGAHSGKDGRVSYYRHSAFNDRFHRFGGQWYLEITPTYHFTYDGFRPHHRAEELLKGIKRIEGHDAVRGQVIMWAAFLTPRADLLRDDPYPFLGYWDLERFEAESGVLDSEWNANRSAGKQESLDEDERHDSDVLDVSQRALFE